MSFARSTLIINDSLFNAKLLSINRNDYVRQHHFTQFSLLDYLNPHGNAGVEQVL